MCGVGVPGSPRHAVCEENSHSAGVTASDQASVGHYSEQRVAEEIITNEIQLTRWVSHFTFATENKLLIRIEDN